MSVLTDTFPSPALDTARWTTLFTGGTGVIVGTPNDGAFPQNVSDDGDEMRISSQNKITTPAGKDFDASIKYFDIVDDILQNIVHFFGWRTEQLDMGGDPAFGLDVMLCVKPGLSGFYQRRRICLGAEERVNLAAELTGLEPGGFRVTRVGNDYALYRDDATLGWVLLETVTLPTNNVGFIVFGTFAEDPALMDFPWIMQPI